MVNNNVVCWMYRKALVDALYTAVSMLGHGYLLLLQC